jgi:hypothetical protein
MLAFVPGARAPRRVSLMPLPAPRAKIGGRFAPAVLGLVALLAVFEPADAAPDISWAPPEDITLNQGDIFSHESIITAYGADGTAWVFYRERAVTGQVIKPEVLVHAYRRPGNPGWQFLTRSGTQGSSQPLVCDLGGGPVFAALGDGRALLVYGVHTGETTPSGSCFLAGIQVLLLDPDQPSPVETFFRAGGAGACPQGRTPRIATSGNTALIAWKCLPTNTNSTHYVESAYFDGTSWTGPLLVPEANSVNVITASPLGRFHTLGRVSPDSPALPRYVSNVFDQATRTWAAQVETVSDTPGSELNARALVAGEDGGVLAGFGRSDSIDNWVRHRDPEGTWGDPVQLLFPGSQGTGGGSPFPLSLAAAGNRYAAVWRFGLPSSEGGLDALRDGFAGAIRRADGSWTTPVDVADQRFKAVASSNTPSQSNRITVVGWPNGSFTSFGTISTPEERSVADLFTSTAPAGSDCWRTPVATAQGIGASVSTAGFDAGPTGDLLAAWIDVTETQDPATLIKVVQADGPDGTGGSDSCEAVDTDPDPFNFASLIDQPLNTVVVSNAVTITGINAPAPVSVVGGEYSIDGGVFTSAAGTVTNGQEIAVRQTTAGASEATTNASLQVGTIVGVFSVTTGDIDPLPFTFTALVDQPLSTAVQSSPVVISGISIPAPISITGGEYSIAGGTFTSAPGTVVQGQQVVVRLTTAGTPSTARTATLTIGSVSGSFSATTGVAASSGGGGSFGVLALLLLVLMAGSRLGGLFMDQCWSRRWRA